MSDLDHPYFDNDVSDRLGGARLGKFGWAILLIAPILGILAQVYVPTFFPKLKYLETPLLIAVYFALLKREPVAGMIYGMAVGLLQDSLSDHFMGMFGIVKTLIGFLAATLSLRIDARNPIIRMVVCFCFFFFHQFLYWVMARALLGEQFFQFQIEETLVLGALNGAVAIPLFSLLDTAKE
jgi:rod shape-determining protein MreD